MQSQIRKYKYEIDRETWADKLRGKLIRVDLFTRDEEDPFEIIGTFVSKPRDIILKDYIIYDRNKKKLEKGDMIMIRESLWKTVRCKSMAGI